MKNNAPTSLVMLAPAAFFLLVIGIVEGVLYAQKRHSESQAQLASLAFASELRLRAERELNTVLHLTSGLSSYLSVRRNTLEASEIEDILGVVYQTSQHIRNFGVAVGYRLSYIYPRGGNEQAIGLDYRSLPQQWPDVERAVVSRRAVLTEQINLIQGGQAFIYREPIYIKGQYWGLLSTVIDSASLLQAMFADIGASYYEFAVRSQRAPDTALWGHPRLFGHPSAVVLSSASGWEFAVIPVSESHWLPIFIMRLFGWVLALVAALGVYSALMHRQTLAHLALHDNVTGLPNRLLLNDRMGQALKRARNTRDLPPKSHVAVVFIDVDDFKQINDRYGHSAGDFVLKEVARRLESCARTGDTVARWAGDEFVVLVEQVTQEGIEPLLQRIDSAIGVPLYYEGQPLQLSVSLGYAFADRDNTNPTDLVWAADRRMYERKRSKH